MAEASSNENLEKSEEPTSKRREEARGKGQFPRSKYLIPAVTLGAIAVALRFAGEELMVRLERCLVGFFAEAGKLKPLAGEDLIELSMQAALLFAPILLPVFAALRCSLWARDLCRAALSWPRSRSAAISAGQSIHGIAPVAERRHRERESQGADRHWRHGSARRGGDLP